MLPGLQGPAWSSRLNRVTRDLGADDIIEEKPVNERPSWDPLGGLLGCLGAILGAPGVALERRKLEKAIT